MAALTNAQRKAVMAEIMASGRMGDIAVDKAGLRKVVNAVDDFLDTNRTAINQSVPQPERSQITYKQTLLTLYFVLQQRMNLGSDA